LPAPVRHRRLVCEYSTRIAPNYQPVNGAAFGDEGVSRATHPIAIGEPFIQFICRNQAGSSEYIQETRLLLGAEIFRDDEDSRMDRGFSPRVQPPSDTAMEHIEITVVRDEDEAIFCGEKELFVIVSANEPFVASSRYLMAECAKK
jgi:hypothetical protein